MSLFHWPISKSTFTRHVLTLAGGTAISQIVLIAVTPLLTRLYSPAQFGVYAVFISVLAVVAAFSTGRYEYAILAEADEENAWHGLGLVVSLAALTGLTTALVGIVGANWVEYSVEVVVSPTLALLAGISVFLMGSYQGVYYWHNRHKRYRQLSQSRIAGSLILAVVSVALGVLNFGAEGLIIGAVSGQAGNLIVLVLNLRRQDGGRTWPGRVGVLAQGREHIDYPRFLIPSGVLDRLSSHSVIILLSAFFGASVSGALGLYQRVVGLPVKIVGNAIADVFKQRASTQLNEHGECRRLFINTALGLLLVGTVPFLVLFLTGPLLFALVFGEEWRVAGEYAQILSWMFLFGFVVSPLSSLFFIGRKQKFDLIMQSFLFTSTVAALYAGSVWGDVRMALFLYTAAYCCKYVIEGGLAWGIASGRF